MITFLPSPSPQSPSLHPCPFFCCLHLCGSFSPPLPSCMAPIPWCQCSSTYHAKDLYHNETREKMCGQLHDSLKEKLGARGFVVEETLLRNITSAPHIFCLACWLFFSPSLLRTHALYRLPERLTRSIESKLDAEQKAQVRGRGDTRACTNTQKQEAHAHTCP